jgi:hypothetical protein
MVSVNCGIPWDNRYDDFSTIPVGGVVGHLEGLEAFPCPTLRVPKIFDPSAAKISYGASFTTTTHSQGVTNCVEDVKVAENGLSENLRVGCGFRLCKTNSYVKPKAKDVFQNECFVCLSLGAAKSQFMSRILGPFPCTRRWT